MSKLESRGGKAVERVKTALIVLLTVSALLLAWRTRLFNDFFASIPLFGNVAELVRGATGAPEAGGAPVKEAARPLTIAVTDEDGRRFAVKYDIEARNALYDRTSSILAEAIGSALELTEITESEWREALLKPGVYYEYVVPVRLSVLDGWLGARMPETAKDLLIRRVLVAFGEARNRIYYHDQESGLFFAADTASTAGKAQDSEAYGVTDALFAFETGMDAAENAPYMLIMPGSSSHPDVRSAALADADGILNAVRAAAGHGNEAFTPYDDDGVLVWVGTQFRISVDPGGRALYLRTDGLPPVEEGQMLGMIGMIEGARAIVADTIGVTSGVAEVFFESYEYEAPGSAVLSFGYYIAGGRVFLQEDGYAARVRFESGVVAEIELYFREFEFTGGYTRLPPERQALAAAGGEFNLAYPETGSEILHPAWVKYEF